MKIDERATVPTEASGSRLDQVLVAIFDDYSRTLLSRWCKEGKVLLNGSRVKPSHRIVGGEQIELVANLELSGEVEPEAIGLDILFEDPDVIVVNKPAGLVVHPAAGNWSGTLQNGLLHYDPQLRALPRSGIVHRLDKETTGVMVVARSARAHKALVAQLEQHTMRRTYTALVRGAVIAGGSVEAAIGRHPRNRLKMAVIKTGKPATTHYKIDRRYLHFTALKVSLETGRTHQIRVHMAYVGFPLVGDPLYSGRPMPQAGTAPEVTVAVRGFARQALHATRLEFEHPAGSGRLAVKAPMPADLQILMEVLNRVDHT